MKTLFYTITKTNPIICTTFNLWSSTRCTFNIGRFKVLLFGKGFKKKYEIPLIKCETFYYISSMKSVLCSFLCKTKITHTLFGYY